VIDLTSSLYLGLRHGSTVLPPWPQLTTGVPAVLAVAPEAGTVAAGLADLIGTKAATLAPSTLHAFWDLFVAMGARQIHVDSGTYPIARWGAERAHCRGAVVRTFHHHDPAALRRAMAAGRGRGPVVLADGLCPGCGGVAPVGEYLAIARHFGGTVVVDDTQALGVLGTPAPGHPYGTGGGGTARWAGLGDARLTIVASLAKGLGVPIAVVAGSRPMVRRYEARAETRVHCSPPSNAHLSAAAHALRCNTVRGDKLRKHLAHLVIGFRTLADAHGVPVMPGLFPIQTVRPMAGVDLQEAHRRLGKLGVQAVLHQPRCGRGAALSVIFTAAHREADVERTVNAIGAALLGAAEGRLAVAG
jgi:8-amino-7-oxononanoate synthase